MEKVNEPSIDRHVWVTHIKGKNNFVVKDINEFCTTDSKTEISHTRGSGNSLDKQMDNEILEESIGEPELSSTRNDELLITNVFNKDIEQVGLNIPNKTDEQTFQQNPLSFWTVDEESKTEVLPFSTLKPENNENIPNLKNNQHEDNGELSTIINNVLEPNHQTFSKVIKPNDALEQLENVEVSIKCEISTVMSKFGVNILSDLVSKNNEQLLKENLKKFAEVMQEKEKSHKKQIEELCLKHERELESIKKNSSFMNESPSKVEENIKEINAENKTIKSVDGNMAAEGYKLKEVSPQASKSQQSIVSQADYEDEMMGESSCQQSLTECLFCMKKEDIISKQAFEIENLKKQVYAYEEDKHNFISKIDELSKSLKERNEIIDLLDKEIINLNNRLDNTKTFLDNDNDFLKMYENQLSIIDERDDDEEGDDEGSNDDFSELINDGSASKDKDEKVVEMLVDELVQNAIENAFESESEECLNGKYFSNDKITVLDQKNDENEEEEDFNLKMNELNDDTLEKKNVEMSKKLKTVNMLLDFKEVVGGEESGDDGDDDEFTSDTSNSKVVEFNDYLKSSYTDARKFDKDFEERNMANSEEDNNQKSTENENSCEDPNVEPHNGGTSNELSEKYLMADFEGFIEKDFKASYNDDNSTKQEDLMKKQLIDDFITKILKRHDALEMSCEDLTLLLTNITQVIDLVKDKNSLKMYFSSEFFERYIKKIGLESEEDEKLNATRENDSVKLNQRNNEMALKDAKMEELNTQLQNMAAKYSDLEKEFELVNTMQSSICREKELLQQDLNLLTKELNDNEVSKKHLENEIKQLREKELQLKDENNQLVYKLDDEGSETHDAVDNDDGTLEHSDTSQCEKESLRLSNSQLLQLLSQSVTNSMQAEQILIDLFNQLKLFSVYQTLIRDKGITTTDYERKYSFTADLDENNNNNNNNNNNCPEYDRECLDSDENSEDLNHLNNLSQKGEFENFIRKSLGGSFTEASLLSCLSENEASNLSNKLFTNLSSHVAGSSGDDVQKATQANSNNILKDSAVRLKTAISFLVEWIQKNENLRNSSEEHKRQQDQKENMLKVNEKVQEQLETLQNDYEEVCDELKQTKSQLHLATLSQETFTAKLDKEMAEKQTLILDLMKTQSLLEGCKGELKICDERIKLLEEKKEAMLVDLETMNGKLEAYKTAEEDLHAKQENLNKQKDVFMLDVDQAFKEVFEENNKLSEECRNLSRRLLQEKQLFESQVKELEHNNDNLSGQLEKVKEDANVFATDAQLKIACLEKQLKMEKKFSLDQSSEREEERDTYQERIDKLNEALHESEKLKQAHKRMKNEIMDLEDQLHEKTQALHTALMSKEEMDLEMGKQIQVSAEMGDAIRALEMELAEKCKAEKILTKKLEDELYEFERIKKIPTFMKKLEKLRTVDESELSSDEESDACRMMAEVDGLKKVLKDTEEAVEGYKEKEKELTRSNNALNDQVAYLQKSLKDLQLDKESLENQLLQQSNTISTLRNNAEGMGIGGVEVGELSKWKSKVDELKECLDLKDKEMLELRRQMKSLTEKLYEMELSVESYEGNERHWVVDKDRMQTLIDTVSSKNEELKKRLMDKEKHESQVNMNLLNEALIAEKNNFINDLTNEKNSLSNQIDSLNLENKAIKNEVNKLRFEISSFENTFYGRSKSFRTFNTDSFGSPEVARKDPHRRTVAFENETDVKLIDRNINDKNNSRATFDSSSLDRAAMLKTVEEANTKKGNFLGLSSTFDNSPRFVMAEEASKVKDDNGQLLKIADQIQDLFSHYTVSSIQELDGLLRQQHQQNTQLYTKLQLEKQANESLVDSINQLKVEIEEGMAANEKELEILREELSSKESLINQLNMQVLDTHNLISSQQQQHSLLLETKEIEVKKLKDLLDVKVNEIGKIKDEVGSKKESYEEEINECNKRIRLLEKIIIEKDDFVKDLQKKTAEFKVKNDDRTSEIECLKEKIKRSQSSIDEEKLVKRKLEEDIKKVEELGKQQKEEFEDKEKHLLNEFETKMNEVIKLENVAYELKTQVSTLHKQLQDSLAKYNEKCLVMDRLESEKRTELQTQKLLHEAELKELCDKLTKPQQKENSSRQLSDEITYKNDQIQMLQQKLQQITSKQQQEVMKTCELQNTIKSLQQQLNKQESMKLQKTTSATTSNADDASFNVTTVSTTLQDITMSYEELSGDLQSILRKLHQEAVRVLSLSDCKYLEALEKKKEERERLQKEWDRERSELLMQIKSLRKEIKEDKEQGSLELEQAIKRCIKTEEKYRELKDMIEGMTLRENSEDVDKFKLSLQQEKATTNELYRLLGEEQKSNENLKKKQDNLKEIIRDLQASIDVTRADNLGIKDADKEEVRHLKKEIDKLKRMLSKAEAEKATGESKLLLQAQELLSTNQQRDYLQNQLAEIKHKLNNIEAQLTSEERRLTEGKKAEEMMIMIKNINLLNQKLQLLSIISHEYIKSQTQSDFNSTNETSMTDLINDICIDVKRMQSLAKGFLSLGKHYSKENLASNRPTSYPSHGDLIGQTEVVDDHVLIHNSKLTQKIQAMSNEINHLKYKLALKEVSSNEDVKLKADRQAFLSQVDPVVTDKEKVQRLFSKYLRAESFRKSLIYQKKYLLFLLGDFKQSEQATLAAIAKLTATARAGCCSAGSRYLDGSDEDDYDVIQTLNSSCPSFHKDLQNNYMPSSHEHYQQHLKTSPRKRPILKFRTAVRAVIGVLRMKFLVKKWQKVNKLGLSSMHRETSARRRLDVESNGNSRRFAREFVNTNENIPPKIFQSSINLATTEIDNNFHHTKSLENMTKNNYYNFRNFDAINSESLSAANQDKQCYNRNHFSQKSSPTPRCFHEVRTHCKKVNSTPPTKESMINGSVKRIENSFLDNLDKIVDRSYHEQSIKLLKQQCDDDALKPTDFSARNPDKNFYSSKYNYSDDIMDIGLNNNTNNSSFENYLHRFDQVNNRLTKPY